MYKHITFVFVALNLAFTGCKKDGDAAAVDDKAAPAVKTASAAKAAPGATGGCPAGLTAHPEGAYCVKLTPDFKADAPRQVGTEMVYDYYGSDASISISVSELFSTGSGFQQDIQRVLEQVSPDLITETGDRAGDNMGRWIVFRQDDARNASKMVTRQGDKRLIWCYADAMTSRADAKSVLEACTQLVVP